MTVGVLFGVARTLRDGVRDRGELPAAARAGVADVGGAVRWTDAQLLGALHAAQGELEPLLRGARRPLSATAVELAVWTRALGLLAVDHAAAAPTVQRRVAESDARLGPAPAARRALAVLGANGCRLGVVSNALGDCRPLLSAPGVPAVGAVVLAVERGHWKPDPEAYLDACADLGVAADHVVYVGRHAADVQGASVAGLTGLLLGTTAPGLASIRSFAALPAAVRTLTAVNA